MQFKLLNELMKIECPTFSH